MAATLCKLFGDLFKGLGNVVSEICVAPCRLCSAVCEPINEGMRKACSSQFILLVVAALALNIPPVYWSFQALPFSQCKGSQWLLVDMLLCLSNITAAVYLAINTQDITEAVSALLYDKFMALYILICVGFFAWLCIGVSWSSQGLIAGDNCHENTSKMVSDSLWCGFFYFFVGGSALMLSLCVSWCRGKKSSSYKSGTTSTPTARKEDYVPPYVANAV